jgi:hypothetical protein
LDPKSQQTGPGGAFLSDVQQTLINTQLHVEKSIKFAKVKFSDWDPKTDRKSILKNGKPICF